jgi:DNA replication protein DnaC
MDTQNNKPFIILGKSETGKTSLMASIAKNVKKYF